VTTVYRLVINCVTGINLRQPFRRVVELDSASSLADLHALIQELSGFDDDHLSTFYLANTLMGQKVWLVDPDAMESDPGVMGDSPLWSLHLNQIFPLPKHKKLYYWFDFGDDWIFEIRKQGKERAATEECHLPRLIEAEGPQPEQYLS
jgi:hypothetical protein